MSLGITASEQLFTVGTRNSSESSGLRVLHKNATGQAELHAFTSFGNNQLSSLASFNSAAAAEQEIARLSTYAQRGWKDKFAPNANMGDFVGLEVYTLGLSATLTARVAEPA